MTTEMEDRQRARKNGKYREMNRCEICYKALGSGYYSAPNCNETGVGVVLCKKHSHMVWSKEFNRFVTFISLKA